MTCHPGGVPEHSHSHLTGSVGRLRVVLVLLVAVLVAEAVGGLLAGSLALLADAGHLMCDAAGVGLALVAASYAARPATASRTYGLARAEVLAAVANAVLLLTVGLAVTGVSVWRLLDPRPSDPAPMAALGALALVVNGTAVWLLRGGAEHSLNLRGAYLEVLADALGAVGVLAAAGAIAATGTRYADPVASLVVGVLIVPRTARLLREAVDSLLDATPRHLDLVVVRDHVMALDGVIGCHDLHAWSIGSTSAVSAHVVLDDDVWSSGDAPAALDAVTTCLADHFGLHHATVQLERAEHAQHESVLHD